MKAMRAETFTGYGDLQLVEAEEPTASEGRVLVRMTAAGVTPLDHTILSGQFPRAAAPLILGNEGMGIVERPGNSGFNRGARVMFFGPYGIFESGTYSQWVAVRHEDLCLVPDGTDDFIAAGLPVAYLTAQITLMQAGFAAGKSVLAPAIGGAVGNAVTQLAQAQGAAYAVSTTSNTGKAARAAELGFDDVVDLSKESLKDGVNRITKGCGIDIVIESVGGDLTGQALATLAMNGTLTTLGYSGGRKTIIDVTDLIWKRARMSGFALGAQAPETISRAWSIISKLLADGKLKPVLERVYPLEQAAEALRHLVEDRPFGRVVLAIS